MAPPELLSTLRSTHLPQSSPLVVTDVPSVRVWDYRPSFRGPVRPRTRHRPPTQIAFPAPARPTPAEALRVFDSPRGTPLSRRSLGTLSRTTTRANARCLPSCAGGLPTNFLRRISVPSPARYAFGIHFTPATRPHSSIGMKARTESLARTLAVVAALLVGACGGVDTRNAATSSAPRGASSSTIARPADTPGGAVGASPSAGSTRSPATASGAIYTCVTERAGDRKESPIDLDPKVASLCARHPEMGPCQYERDVCRKSGGRVYAMDGREITREIEDEYDRKVMRVRFRAN